MNTTNELLLSSPTESSFEEMVHQVRELVAMLTGGSPAAANAEPARDQQVDGAIDSPELHGIIESLAERSGALLRQAELSRATAAQRARDFHEWILRPDSGLPQEALRLLKKPCDGLDKAPTPAATGAGEADAIVDPVECRLHRTLVGTMQSIVEHLPEEVLGMNPLRVYIRWKEVPGELELDAELCVPARDPNRVIGRVRDMAEEAARWQGEFPAAVSKIVAGQLLLGLRAGTVVLPGTECVSTGRALTGMRWFRSIQPTVAGEQQSVAHQSSAFVRSAELEAHRALADQQPVILAIIDVVLNSAPLKEGELVDLLRPICQVFRVDPREVTSSFARLGYARLKELSETNAGELRDRQTDQLQRLLREIEAIGPVSLPAVQAR